MSEQRRDRKGRYATGPVSVPTASSTPRQDSGGMHLQVSASIGYATTYDRVKHLIAPSGSSPVPMGPVATVKDRDGVPQSPIHWTPDKLADMFNEGDWQGTTRTETDGTLSQEWRNSYSGAVMTLRNGKLDSRNGEPAVVTPDGSRMWFHEGLLHGDPAVALPDGTRISYEYGVKRKVAKANGPVSMVPVSPVNRLVNWMLRERKH